MTKIYSGLSPTLEDEVSVNSSCGSSSLSVSSLCPSYKSFKKEDELRYFHGRYPTHNGDFAEKATIVHQELPSSRSKCSDNGSFRDRSVPALSHSQGHNSSISSRYGSHGSHGSYCNYTSNGNKKDAGDAGTSGTMKALRPDFVLGPFDVLCARGKVALHHPGNLRFRSIINDHLPEYENSQNSKLDKSLIVSRIIALIREGSPDGGFVREVRGVWYEVGDHIAREKCGQCIRDLLHTKYKSSTKAKCVRRKKNKSSISPKDNDTLEDYTRCCAVAAVEASASSRDLSAFPGIVHVNENEPISMVASACIDHDHIFEEDLKLIETFHDNNHTLLNEIEHYNQRRQHQSTTSDDENVQLVACQPVMSEMASIMELDSNIIQVEYAEGVIEYSEIQNSIETVEELTSGKAMMLSQLPAEGVTGATGCIVQEDQIHQSCYQISTSSTCHSQLMCSSTSHHEYDDEGRIIQKPPSFEAMDFIYGSDQDLSDIVENQNLTDTKNYDLIEPTIFTNATPLPYSTRKFTEPLIDIPSLNASTLVAIPEGNELARSQSLPVYTDRLDECERHECQKHSYTAMGLLSTGERCASFGETLFNGSTLCNLDDVDNLLIRGGAFAGTGIHQDEDNRYHSFNVSSHFLELQSSPLAQSDGNFESSIPYGRPINEAIGDESTGKSRIVLPTSSTSLAYTESCSPSPTNQNAQCSNDASIFCDCYAEDIDCSTSGSYSMPEQFISTSVFENISPFALSKSYRTPKGHPSRPFTQVPSSHWNKNCVTNMSVEAPDCAASFTRAQVVGESLWSASLLSEESTTLPSTTHLNTTQTDHIEYFASTKAFNSNMEQQLRSVFETAKSSIGIQCTQHAELYENLHACSMTANKNFITLRNQSAELKQPPRHTYDESQFTNTDHDNLNLFNGTCTSFQNDICHLGTDPQSSGQDIIQEYQSSSSFISQSNSANESNTISKQNVNSTDNYEFLDEFLNLA